MNYVNTNRINNFKKLEKVIEERKLIIYRKILYLIENCQIIEEDSTGIIIEIDLTEHCKLLEDLNNSFFTKKISTRKVEKNWTRLFCGKSILDNKNLQ